MALLSVFWGGVVFLWFSQVPHYQHPLVHSLSWFYWVSHTFRSILLLQDTSFCVFCQPASWWQILKKITGIGTPCYCQLLSDLKHCLCLSPFQADFLLEAALVLVCRASDWHCSSFQQCLTFENFHTTECFFSAVRFKEKVAEHSTARSGTCFVSCSHTGGKLVTKNVWSWTDFVCVCALFFLLFSVCHQVQEH